MLCWHCGHFVKCPGCDGYLCPACGSELLESERIEPGQVTVAQAPMEIVATGHPV